MKIQMSIGSLGAISTGFLLVGAGTLALFTGTATNSSNTFNAGKVQISDVTGRAAFSQTVHFNNLAPGDSETANVSVQNTGNLDEWVYLDGPASIQTERGALFQGAHPLAITFDSNPVLLHPGETKPLSVSYSLPTDAGNEYQSTNGTMNIVIDAVQARDNTKADGSGPSTPIPTGSGTGVAATVTGLQYAQSSVTPSAAGSGSVFDSVSVQPTVKDATGNILSNSGTYSLTAPVPGVSVNPTTGQLSIPPGIAVGGSISVTYTQGTATETVSVALTAGAAAHFAVTPAGTTSVGISGTQAVTVTVTDANGNVVAGTTVTFTLLTGANGFLSEITATTDASGVATVNYSAPATGEGAADIVAVTVPGATATGSGTIEFIY